ncbi:hypothetical protein SLEP1_g35296 [Rubroshorea leprosula]|uniref:Kinesin motor domain-containing protein n=1 Tax=Rubroshorea leprosula TaxID=152421 RepID=A0AAV5KMS4_9ROSI|nr:hypothetical protein SLEP1_g35296 [Rubroshorea leprosula]
MEFWTMAGVLACISLADLNAGEMINTLKYANRACNIQNKPVVNRDPITNDMLNICQQLEYLQAELYASGGFKQARAQKSYVFNPLNLARIFCCHLIYCKRTPSFLQLKKYRNPQILKETTERGN